MACFVAVGLGAFVPAADAAPLGQSISPVGSSAANDVIEIENRGHRPRILLPRGPGQIYYDYPYYYSRGYYPTHIGPGYVYDSPYSYGEDYYPQHNDRCAKWHRKCTGNWGAGNEDYQGCMEYHDCD